MTNNTSDKIVKIISTDGKAIDIPPEGLLGLLALGATGLKIWRQARKEAGITSHWQSIKEDIDKEDKKDNG